MLLNAEKSQEMIWNSVRLGGRVGPQDFVGGFGPPPLPPQMLEGARGGGMLGGFGGSGSGRESVQEITARLLFMVIRWVKCLPTFQTLTKTDQVSHIYIVFKPKKISCTYIFLSINSYNFVETVKSFGSVWKQ